MDVSVFADYWAHGYSSLKELSSREIFNRVRIKAKSEDAQGKLKAERLLDQLRESVFAITEARLPYPDN